MPRTRAMLTALAVATALIAGSIWRGDNVAAQADAVTGTVTYLERIALPPNAVVIVRLVDVSRADAPAVILVEQQIATNGKQVPFAFTLTYDPARIDPRSTYAVQARIEVDGQLWFVTTERYAVITQGNPTQIEVIVRRTGGPTLPGTGGGGMAAARSQPTGLLALGGLLAGLAALGAWRRCQLVGASRRAPRQIADPSGAGRSARRR